ncbi:MAG TPA: hypothetical protein VMU27_01120, partial [Candidatus Paceibacterota bacterium]|nr:hypothetical protein [Candidatus Paceibacterota bacterium]
VRLGYTLTNSFQETLDKIMQDIKEADFVDGILFSKSYGVVMKGNFCEGANLPKQSFSKITNEWFYLHAERISRRSNYEELIPIQDYLFRYDRSGFWAGKYAFRYFKIPQLRLFRLIFNPVLRTKRLYKVLHATNIAQRYIVQDITVPRDSTLSFLHFLDERLHIYPLWICPLRQDTAAFLSPNFIKTDLAINIGIWGENSSDDFYKTNRELERFAEEIGGRKVLYAHTYYPKEEFWQVYDRVQYDALRNKYYADRVFPTIYEKVFVGERYVPNVAGGLWKLIKEKLKRVL